MLRRQIYFFISIALFLFVFQSHSAAQSKNSADFETVLAQKLAKAQKTVLVNGKPVKQTGISLNEICDLSDPVASRVFAEYGAMFAGESDVFAGFSQAMTGNSLRFLVNCVFENEEEVNLYQSNVKTKTATIGGTSVELQEDAMDALLDAVEEARERNLRLTPRGGATASKRSYRQTVELWNSRFFPALNFHVGKGRIARREADAVKTEPIHTQVEKVLAWEDRGYFFSKDLSKSILYSVAAPGASQHIFMLALDVEQFANPQVRRILAEHGWYQTVLSDLPHFTYLGVSEDQLPALGLVAKFSGGQKFWVPNLK